MNPTHYPITPMGKPRMTQRDKWKKRPVVLRYRQFKDDCRRHGVTLHDAMRISFRIPMPTSWSKRKRDSMRGKPHRQRPDLDNLEKALLDAVLTEDSAVHTMHADKTWADEGSFLIWNLESDNGRSATE